MSIKFGEITLKLYWHNYNAQCHWGACVKFSWRILIFVKSPNQEPRQSFPLYCILYAHVAFPILSVLISIKKYEFTFDLSGSELLQLQSELNRLADPADPAQVADYLSLRCEVTHLRHDVTIRHNLRRALIMADNVHATKVIKSS